MGLAKIWEKSQFEFTIRPSGASYPGVMSDVDEQWRSDYFENDHQLAVWIFFFFFFFFIFLFLF